MARLARAPKGEVEVIEGPLLDPETAEMSNLRLAEDIVETQEAILRGWKSAIGNFHTVLTSASDAEAHTDLAGVLRSFAFDKALGALTARVPGLGPLVSLDDKLSQELERARTATLSATLREFVVDHERLLDKLLTKLTTNKAEYKSKVENVTKAAFGQDSNGAAFRAWADMRRVLAQLRARIDAALLTPEQYFLGICEQWMLRTTVERGQRSHILIKLEEDEHGDWTTGTSGVKEVEIRAPGGKKIAEQLKKDWPNGLDVYRMYARRWVLLRPHKSSWPKFVLKLDEKGRDDGSILYSHAQLAWRVKNHLDSFGLKTTRLS